MYYTTTMKIKNMSKRQESDQRTENRQRTPIGLQRNQKILHPEADLSWPLNKNEY